MTTSFFHYSAKEWFDVEDLFILYASLGALILLYGVFSRIIKSWLLSEIVVAIGVGMLIGVFPGYAYTLINISHWFPDISIQRLMLELSRLAIAIQLVATAIRLPRKYLFRAYKPLFGLLVLVLLLAYFTGGLLAYGIMAPRFSFSEAMIIGGFICSTDPVISASIVSGQFAEERLSTDLRHLLEAESGANDGLAYPLVMLPLLFQLKMSSGDIWAHWFLKTILYDIVAGSLIGFAIGYIVGKAFQIAEHRKFILESSLLGLTFGLTIFVLGVMKMMNTDEILAVFAAGIGFNFSFRDSQHEAKKAHIQQAIDLIFTIGIFVFFGMCLPYHGFRELGWQGALYCLATVLLHRIFWVMLIYPFLLRPYIETWKEALFFGWFGPIGVACLYYTAFTYNELIEVATSDQQRAKALQFWYVGTELVLFSAVIYGITDVPFTILLYRFNKPHLAPDDVSNAYGVTPHSVASTVGTPDTIVNIPQQQRVRGQTPCSAADDTNIQPDVLDRIETTQTMDNSGISIQITRRNSISF
jgi:NhaP-type Na+/H+ or K+/H+ antiporter